MPVAEETATREMRLMGSKQMLDEMISEETKEMFDLDIQGGDTRIIWNPRDRDEAAAAKATFDDLSGTKRFLAFRVDAEGDKGEQIDEWDPEAGKLILAPPMAGG